MNELQNLVQTYFGKGNAPRSEELTIDDGYDQLEKEYALKIFSNKPCKTWESLLKEMLEKSSYVKIDLEVWTVLEVEPLKYYFRSYAEYLLQTLQLKSPDIEFLIEFFHQLYQLVCMKKFDKIGFEEIKVINQLVALVENTLDDPSKEWEDHEKDHLRDNILMFREAEKSLV